MQLWCLMIDQQEWKQWFQVVFFSQRVKRKYYEAGEQLSKNLLIIVVTCERSLHDTPEVGQHGFQWIGNGSQSPPHSYRQRPGVWYLFKSHVDFWRCISS